MITGQLGHYEIIELLATTGMSEVYRAHDTRLDRDVALKVLPPELARSAEFIHRFEREARAVATLNHPNIVTIYSIEVVDDVHFYTMELISGVRLDALLPAEGFPTERLLELALSLADALGAAHEQGITHRDLKPGNVLVTAAGEVKILDFGLARRRTPLRPAGPAARDPHEDTEPGRILGTAPYMAPEQIEGDGVDSRTDVFALGVVMYELATGRRPFQGRSPAELLCAILRDPPPPGRGLRPDLPEAFWRLVDSCLAKEPGRRPASGREVREELLRLEPASGPPALPALPSVAVLQFRGAGPGEDQAHLCEGLAEELISRLTRISGLRVAARMASFAYAASGLDARAIGARLGVRAILDGSVRRAGGRLRITARLTDVANGNEVWSERYDREAKDVFAIEDDLARRIVEALEITLTPVETRAIGNVGTTDLTAYEYYLRGRTFYFQYNRRGIEGARHMFQLALRHDSEYALAWCGVSDCASYLFLYADHRVESLAEADAASLRALALNPTLAEVHTSRGQVLSLSGRHEEAEHEFETAIRLAPRLFEAHYLYARDSFAQGKLESSARLFEQAERIRPEDYQSPLLLAQIYEARKQPEMAREVRRRGVRLAERRLALSPGDVRALYMGANGLMALGERERALEWAGLAQNLDPEDPMVLYNLGCIYSLGDAREQALECLEGAVRAGLTQKGWFDHDANLDPLRDEPRFRAMLPRLS